MSNSGSHLQVVNENFSRPRARQFVPNFAEQEAGKFQCIEGGKPKVWKELAADSRMANVTIQFADGSFKIETHSPAFGTDTSNLKRHQTSHFTCWIDEEGPARIPWARIERGETWSAELRLRDFYFQKRAENLQRINAQKENFKRHANQLLS